MLAALEVYEISEDVLRSHETGRQVRAALDQLDPELARILILKYREDRTVAWIANSLGKSEKAIESRLWRAREELRMLLKGTLHDSEF